MAGLQYNMKEYEYTYLRTTGILPSLEVPNSNNGLIYLVSEDKNTQSSKWQEAVMSYFGRANYNYRSKYMLEAQFRYDGSSKFQPENRWAFYWGTSGGWRLSEEDFIKELEFIDVAEEPKKTEKKRKRAISQKEADKRGQIFAMLLLTVVLCAAVYALIRTLGIGV